MEKMLNNKIFRSILSVVVIASMFFVPSAINEALGLIGLRNDNISHILSLMMFLLVLVLIYFSEFKKEFVIFKKNFKKCLDSGFKYWMLGFFIMICSNIVINFLIMGGNIAANEEMNRQAIMSNPLWYTILSIVLIAPLLEETIFRKSLDKIFNKPIYYCVISGLLFGFAHVMADLSSVLNLLYLIPYGGLGFCLAKMDVETETTFTSILFHSLHNLLTLLALLLVVL